MATLHQTQQALLLIIELPRSFRTIVDFLFMYRKPTNDQNESPSCIPFPARELLQRFFLLIYRKPTNDPKDWPPYTVPSKPYLFLDTDVTEIRHDFRPAKMALWNRLIPHLLAALSLSQNGGGSGGLVADCWTVTALIVVGVVAVAVIVFLVFIVRYIRLKQKLQRVKYLHSLPEKT
jgi:hypothetical protein